MTTKSHDYDLVFGSVKHGAETYRGVVHKLTGCLPGSSCVVYPWKGAHCRKTKNEGAKGSIRYEFYTNETKALAAGVLWAQRKDREYEKRQKELAKYL